MRPTRAGALLLLATAGYLIVLIALAPSGNPTVAVLVAVPVVIAGRFFGLRVAVPVIVGLAVVTGVILNLLGPGVDLMFRTYRGIPLLMLVMVGVVVGRLRDMGTELEQELEHRRQVEMELRDTQSRLEGLLESKDELIASVGHELRTPLTAVLGFAEMLRIGNAAEMAPGDREEMVGFIAREAFELSGIIDDLLVAARIEIGTLDTIKVPTALRAQVAQAVESWDPQQITCIEISGDNAKANADPARVRQILRNLITNALRHGGDRISVEIRTEGPDALVEIRDNGPGLPKEEWEKIFTPYYRIQREFDGVQQHSGELRGHPHQLW